MKTEIINQIKAIPIDTIKVSKIEQLYQTQIPEIAKHIVSAPKEGMFIDEWRLISDIEILKPYESIHVDFPNLHILPLIDVGDNDYIVYLLEDKKWAMFNIVDNITFMEKEALGDYCAFCGA